MEGSKPALGQLYSEILKPGAGKWSHLSIWFRQAFSEKDVGVQDFALCQILASLYKYHNDYNIRKRTSLQAQQNEDVRVLKQLLESI